MKTVGRMLQLNLMTLEYHVTFRFCKKLGTLRCGPTPFYPFYSRSGYGYILRNKIWNYPTTNSIKSNCIDLLSEVVQSGAQFIRGWSQVSIKIQGDCPSLTFKQEHLLQQNDTMKLRLRAGFPSFQTNTFDLNAKAKKELRSTAM
jgi:hypothetical protein